MNERKVIQAALKVRQAITNEGRMPSHHQEVMRRHRQEWPTLWAALDELVRALDV